MTQPSHKHASDAAAYVDWTTYERKEYSQTGQDGIIHELMTRLGVFDGPAPGWCVEFGAWDGIHLSNTYNLIKNHGFRGVLIEGEEKRYKQLCKNIPSDEIVKVCRFVSLTGADTLDAILGETPIPEDFDLLSIDIDGCDYHVWESMVKYRPKIAIIEYNETIPVELAYVQPADFSVKQGSGAKALDDLGRAKGYTTIHVDGMNVFQVRDDLLDQVTPVAPPPIEDLVGRGQGMYVFVGFDGSILSNKTDLPMNWHPTNPTLEDLQVLPRFLRKYSGFYTPFHWLAFGTLDYWRRLKQKLRKG